MGKRHDCDDSLCVFRELVAGLLVTSFTGVILLISISSELERLQQSGSLSKPKFEAQQVRSSGRSAIGLGMSVVLNGVVCPVITTF